MNLRGLISVCCVLYILSVSTGCTQQKNPDSASHQAAGIGLSESYLNYQNPVIIYLTDNDIYSENRFLHSVNWELRQPRDLSVSSVTTTAVSGAMYVDFFYSCGNFRENNRAVPGNGTIEDQIVMSCQDELSARMEAVTEDTIAVYEFEIDIPFLNSLSE